MKILKIFGIVVGIHVFALVLIFANPGCSSSSKPTPAPIDTVAKADPLPNLTIPNSSPTVVSASPTPIAFNPDAPATAAPLGGVRFTPTRPGTPAASTLVTEPVRDVTPMTTYTVKSGDSLWSIANKNKLTYQDLAAANNLKSNAALLPGQKLIIPGKVPTPEPAPTVITAINGSHADAAAKPASTALRHTVKSGETLSTIAQKYGVRQRDLAIANNITDPLKLAAGKELIIPGWDTPGGKASGKAPAKSSVSPAGAKSAADAKSVFVTPTIDQSTPIVIGAQPAGASTDVPVIRVEETPAPKKP